MTALVDWDGLTAGVEDTWCQRWYRREPSWLHTSEGGFNPRRYTVTPIEWGAAQRFVTTHHYSGAFSSAVRRYGLIDRWKDKLVGACVLGNSMGPHVLRSPFPGLKPCHESLELSRLVLLDEVPSNAESWFAAEALTHAARKTLRGVVMYSDPNERTTPAGLIMPGHLGIIYQALNCWYVGQSKARYEDHLPDGTVLPERTASKIRGLEQGYRGAVRRLVALGADDPGDMTRMTDDERGDWTVHALTAVRATRVRRDGKHRYLLATGTRTQRRVTYRQVPLKRCDTYPKHQPPSARSRKDEP